MNFLREGFLFDASSCLLFLFSLTRRRQKVVKKSKIETIQIECNAVLNSHKFMNLEKTDADFCGVNQFGEGHRHFRKAAVNSLFGSQRLFFIVSLR